MQGRVHPGVDLREALVARLLQIHPGGDLRRIDLPFGLDVDVQLAVDAQLRIEEDGRQLPEAQARERQVRGDAFATAPAVDRQDLAFRRQTKVRHREVVFGEAQVGCALRRPAASGKPGPESSA